MTVTYIVHEEFEGNRSECRQKQIYSKYRYNGTLNTTKSSALIETQVTH